MARTEVQRNGPSAVSSNVSASDGFVRDESAAIDIAVKAWIPMYGKENILDEEPYSAELKNGVWTVTGSLPEGMDGGVATARISQKDGKVLELGHGE